MPRLTLYSRLGCHLCDEMLGALRPLAHEFGLEIDIIDIDDDEVLGQRFNEQVPVLSYNNEILCFHFLDEVSVRDALNRGRDAGEY